MKSRGMSMGDDKARVGMKTIPIMSMMMTSCDANNCC